MIPIRNTALVAFALPVLASFLFTIELNAAEPPPRFEFTRLIAHWSDYGDDDYLKFVEDARPEVCQIGFYGGHFYSLAHTPQFKGYPAHFPLQGLPECGQWFETRNAAIHRLGAKVVGHFNVTFLIGEPDGPDGPQGFFKFYRDLWDEKELGPRPVANPLDLMARNADGSPMASAKYSIGKMREFTACLNNPNWRTVLKAWAKRGIARGVDGYIANYFYRHNCLCPYCRAGFKTYLAKRFTPEELKAQFQIPNLGAHWFTEIVGWHDPKESTPLRREMLRWSQIVCKEAFDDVFLRYGRSLKPDLIVAQWNHLGNFNQISGDERSMLPAEWWGRDEDYLWYSTGDAANSTDLAAGDLGEATLQARYIRGAFADKPFTLGKYESTRTRVAIAELAANGGAPMGFYTRFKDEAARRELVRYYRFLEKHDADYRGSTSYGDVLLLYPRYDVRVGNLKAVENFKKAGRDLLDKHVLFDVRPDDLEKVDQRPRYAMEVDPSMDEVLFAEKPLPEWSQIEAPKTVRVSANRSADGSALTLHFVNYNRTEPAKKRSAGRGIQDERPIAVKGVKVDFKLPEGAIVKAVTFATPEVAEDVQLQHAGGVGRVQFGVPEFLVYGVVKIQLQKK